MPFIACFTVFCLLQSDLIFLMPHLFSYPKTSPRGKDTVNILTSITLFMMFFPFKIISLLTVNYVLYFLADLLYIFCFFVETCYFFHLPQQVCNCWFKHFHDGCSQTLINSNIFAISVLVSVDYPHALTPLPLTPFSFGVWGVVFIWNPGILGIMLRVSRS